ncbi:MAG: THxN family PEP-CTERM protein [Pseudomonadota bacterium]
MSRVSFLKSCVLGMSLVAFGGTAQAALVSITDLDASWINIDPGSITPSGNGTDFASMRWGTVSGNNPQSGYDFGVAATPIDRILPPSPSTPFTLGTWTHLNNPILAPSLTSATLQLDAAVSIDGSSQGVFSFLFDFTHFETPNNASTCANGGANGVGVNVNGCADLVTVSANAMSDSVLIGGDLFTLTLDSLTSTSFETIERANNRFTISGFWALDSRSVPEPGILTLLGMGFVGLGLAGRRRKVA